MKKVAVIGGTGSAGREVIRLALKADYKVTAVARIPDSIKPQNNLTVVYGDVTDLESLKEAFKHVDVVISCFGPANGRKAGNIMSVGTYNMVKACEEHAVGRLTLLNRLALKFIRLFFKGVYRDKIIAENSIQSSSLPWVIVRAVGLSDAAPTGKYSAGVALKVSPFTPLPYTDLALCLLDAVEEDGWTRKIVNVGKE
jgi:uncharacterized protein YbjT (DUF2867 family)